MVTRRRAKTPPVVPTGGRFPLADNAAQILQHNDVQYDFVDVPQWNCRIRLRTLSLAEAQQWLADNLLPDKQQSSGTRLIALSAVKPTSNDPLFTEADVEALAKKDAHAVTLVFTAANKLNRLVILPDDSPGVADAKNGSSEAAVSASPTS